MRGRRFFCIVAFVLAGALSGCGSAGGVARTPGGRQQSVSDVLEQQTGTTQADASEAAEGFSGDALPAYAEADIDVDLTSMSADMVYATVYNMMTNPSAYLGKVVRMEGPFYHSYYEETQGDYFYVIIQDATACCAQGLEFVWDDGSHAYPDDYPADGAEVVVAGRFEVYDEDGSQYVHLVDASLEAA